MTKTERRAIGRYVREIADRVGLRDWTFNLEHDDLHPDEEAIMKVTPIYGQKFARLKFCGDFLDLKKEAQRHAVVHELVHCHWEPAAQLVLNLKNTVGEIAHAPLWSAFHQESERAVDAIAVDWAKTLPLPDDDVPHGKTVAIVPFDVPPD